MRRERVYFVYIMASRPYGTLYVGVTNDLLRRVYEHREGLVDGFTKRYGVKTLVYFESFAMAVDAIHREKRIKKWPRQYRSISSWRAIPDGTTCTRGSSRLDMSA